MSSSVVRLLGVLAPVALGVLAGCGAAGAEGAEPQVPKQPVGYDDPSARAEPAEPAGKEYVIGAEDDTYSDADPQTVDTFRPALAPYGEWRDDSSYGTVWVPSPTVVGPEFEPYVTAGYWSYDSGYVWVSDYEWGWAPFHYGRWVYITGTGWAWIPGRRYAGAWVVWHTGPVGYGYVGWAPMPPEWYWYGGTAVVLAYRPYPRYHYCHTQYFFDRRVHEHMVPMASTPQIAANMSTWAPSSGGDGRVPANPSVNGSGHVLANPSVSGGAGDRVVANPRVAGAPGPSPGDLGIPSDRVNAVPKDNRGLWRAQQSALPSSSPPVAITSSPPRGASNAFGATPPVASPRGLEPVVRSPQYVGVEPRAPHALPSYGDAPRTASPPSFGARPQPSPSVGATAPPPVYSAPSRVAPSSPSPAPVTRSAPTYSPPAPRSTPSFSSPGPAPVVRSSPPSPPPQISRPAPAPPPAVRPAPPKPASPAPAPAPRGGVKR